MLELNLELITLLDKFLLLLSEVRALLLDDQCEELILKTGLGDSEVDECALGLDLRWIVRVRQLGVH